MSAARIDPSYPVIFFFGLSLTVFPVVRVKTVHFTGVNFVTVCIGEIRARFTSVRFLDKLFQPLSIL